MEPTKVTYDISRRYLEDRRWCVPDSIYNRLTGWIRSRNYQSLATCFTDSLHDVTCAELARTLLQVEAFFKKNVSFTVPLEARLAAILSFEEGEALCQATNDRLDSFYAELTDFSLEIKKMQFWISAVLGPFEPFLEQLPKLGKVTAGATASLSRRRALPHLRISKKMRCTPGAFPFIDTLSKFFGYGAVGGRLISCNRVAFVPKSWKTERTIACEAEGNSFLQLAFDTYAKRRLQRVGINLHDQTQNQKLAKEGSINGDFATIDLSMASDTLSYNTVCLLLPEAWFSYLRSIRSQYYEMYVGSRASYHKFSSMGNGATFALETLVFAAACYSVGSVAFSVYGDDIVIERDKAARLIELLAFLGFIPNSDKSYIDGPFRESCGVSCWNGLDITPKYIRDFDSRKSVLSHIVNSMMAISEPFGSLQTYLASLVRDAGLPLVPYNEDSMSGVWVDTHTAYERKLIRTARKGHCAWIPRFKSLKMKSRRTRYSDIRSLFLWYLDTWDRSFVRDPVERSWYTHSSHKYVRKWVHWKPVAGAPESLYSFSDQL